MNNKTIYKEVFLMFYKRLIISLLILSLVFAFTGCLGKLFPTTPSVAPSAGTTGVLFLEPANLTLTPSQDFAVELKTSAITDLKGYSVTLSYDPALIRLNEVTESPFFSSEGETFFYRAMDNQQGSVLIDCAILGRDLAVSGEGTLATLSFTCLKDGQAEITFKAVDTRDTHNKAIVTTQRNLLVKSR